MPCSTMVSGQGEGERERGAHASEKRSVAWRRRGGGALRGRKRKEEGAKDGISKKGKRGKRGLFLQDFAGKTIDLGISGPRPRQKGGQSPL